MEWVALFILFVVIVAAIQYWQITLSIAALAAIIWMLVKWNEIQKNRDAERKAHEASQTQLGERIRNVCSQTLSTFEAMPQQLLAAEDHLDKAETDFAEGVFAPFWDSIEKAAICLGRFDGGVQYISTSAQQHAELAKSLDIAPPTFPVRANSVRALTAASTTNDRMRGIVRRAQKDFHFATIYEQRRTNQILIAGFQNLAQAMEGLGDRIVSSIETLEGQLSGQLSEMSSSLEGMRTTVDDLRSSIDARSSEQAERYDKALEILNSIQRRRRPMGSRGLKDLGTERY
ncbi:MAG: hypothetical protein HYR72_26570 [Deltaproteobacteria bacterium]|nr:hypothetical protein [Deltaproteobacteria bacterium]MBI3390420.1 hypothetical protein [Deltaproteobacteria bacterium]